MSETALILGASGRFASAVAEAMAAEGWEIRRFRRGSGPLAEAARGCGLIVNGWNPPYPRWEAEVPGLVAQIVEAARASGATVLQPLNVYVYGPGSPEVLKVDTPHRATHPLGRVRIALETRLREAGVPLILLRAGDFIDTRRSGNWLDSVIAKPLAKGRITYPGPLDRVHAWAFLPDLARAAAGLVAMRKELPEVCEVPFPGHAPTGADLAQAIGEGLGRPVEARVMNWLPLQIARPFWPMAKGLLEMRYLWDMPHRLDPGPMEGLLPRFRETPAPEALRAALG